MLSHQAVVANILMTVTFEARTRDMLAEKKNMSRYKDTVLGLLPFSHIYGLSVISNTSTYRGDTTVVVPKFERRSLLSSVQDYEISTLYIVSTNKFDAIATHGKMLRYEGTSDCHFTSQQQNLVR